MTKKKSNEPHLFILQIKDSYFNIERVIICIADNFDKATDILAKKIMDAPGTSEIDLTGLVSFSSTQKVIGKYVTLTRYKLTRGLKCDIV